MIRRSSGVAVVGVGITEPGQCAGISANEIAVEAAQLALCDAGIEKSDIDGLITCKAPLSSEGLDEQIGALLGVNPAFSATLDYGSCAFSLHLGEMAIRSGLATTLILTYGTNQRTRRTSFEGPAGGWGAWTSIAGLFHIAGPAAMAFRRHQYLYGTTEEQLGWVSVAQREWARMNPIAIFQEPLTIDDYMASPYIVEPLRRADLTMISDGGAAVVMTTVERSGDISTPPIYMVAMAEQAALRSYQNRDALLRPWLSDVARRVYRSAGMGPADIDIVYIQDATSVWVLQMLESYGFCGQGEGGEFLAEGSTRPGGALPTNTNGGQLSESYSWGWTQFGEAVRQLRGECGERQVSGAEVALFCSTHDFLKGAASIISNRKMQ